MQTYCNIIPSYPRVIGIVTLVTCFLLATSCSTAKAHHHARSPLHPVENAIPRIEPHSRYGNPASYEINHHRYRVLKTAKNYDKVGIASWYGPKFDGKLTSNRERFNMYKMTAASRNLPLPTYVRVTNLENHRSVILRVNDRGPFKHNRLIDLSYIAAKKLGLAKQGTTRVRVTSINPRQWLKTHKKYMHSIRRVVLPLPHFN